MLQENPDDRPNIEQVKKRVEELRISPPTKKKVCNKLSFCGSNSTECKVELYLLIRKTFSFSSIYSAGSGRHFGLSDPPPWL